MEKILLATDLSVRCDRALERAIELAGQFRAELRIVHIVEESSVEFLTTEHEAAARRAVEHQIEALPKAKALKITPHVMRGLDYQDIICEAEANNTDLLVLGTHRHDTYEMFKGTTAERVVRYGRLPVLVVKDPVYGPYRSALVAVDLSSQARAAMGMAAKLAPKGVVHLLHVSHRYSHAFMRRKDEKELIREEREQVKSALEGDIKRISDELGPAAPRFEIVLIEGNVLGAVRDTVADRKPDFLAVGTHGRTGIGHAILGSVAEDLLARAPVDVLAVKSVAGA